MIGVLPRGSGRFLQAPIAATEEFRDAVLARAIAIMAPLTAVLTHIVINCAYGSYVWLGSFAAGGKRHAGPALGLVTSLLGATALAFVLWGGLKLFDQENISAALAIWMTVPYAVAEHGLDVIEPLTAMFFNFATVDLYGEIFTVAFIGQTLALVLAVKALRSDRDWLSCLPVGLCALLSAVFAPLVPIFLLAFVPWKLLK